MDLFDAHCHLQDRRLASDLDAVVARARAAGVRRVCCCAAAEEDWPAVAAAADQLAGFVVPAFGLHPWYVERRGRDWEAALAARLARPGAVVGEIGLDHAVDGPPRDVQDRVFQRQLEMAAERGLPVNVHCLRAWGSLLEHLRGLRTRPPAIVIHSYSGAPELIPELARLGAYFSFSGAVTRPASRRARASAAAVPADRLLLETDAPDLAPLGPGEARVPPGSVNEPANLVRVLEAVAALRGAPVRDIAARAWENAAQVFQGPAGA